MSLHFPQGRDYHAGHLWAIQEEGNTFRIGITDFAQQQLGAVIFVDLPTVGSHFAQNTSCASIESVKVTSEALIPLGGTIVEVNPALEDAPELLNSSPYEQGWLVRITADNPQEPGRITAADYAKQVG